MAKYLDFVSCVLKAGDFHVHGSACWKDRREDRGLKRKERERTETVPGDSVWDSVGGCDS